MKKTRRKKGFTLIELLLVIILISLLAAMVVPRFVGRSEQAKQSAAEADINANLAVALDLYELDNGQYPTSEQGLGALSEKPTFPPEPKNWQGPYIRSKKGFKDPWGNQYQYTYPCEHNKDGYDLYSFGPDALEGTSDDIVNWEEEGAQP